MALLLETCRQYLSYDPETGIFTRKVDYGMNGRYKAGTIAGTKWENGYVVMNMAGRMIYLHRLAFLFMTGEMPPADVHVDHIDGNKSNNAWKNLRLCTPSENHQNRWKASKSSTSKYIGVFWHSQAKRWAARIKLNYKHKNLGLFDTEEAAYEAYMQAKRQYHPFAFSEPPHKEIHHAI
jgi:hypothetical protein